MTVGLSEREANKAGLRTPRLHLRRHEASAILLALVASGLL